MGWAGASVARWLTGKLWRRWRRRKSSIRVRSAAPALATRCPRRPSVARDEFEVAW